MGFKLLPKAVGVVAASCFAFILGCWGSLELRLALSLQIRFDVGLWIPLRVDFSLGRSLSCRAAGSTRVLSLLSGQGLFGQTG